MIFAADAPAAACPYHRRPAMTSPFDPDRPWPPPARPWDLAMRWSDLLFLHWPIDAALLRGPIDVYQRGTYLMTSRLPPTAPRGKVRLGLGVEQAIKVARNTTFAEKATGLLGGGLSLVHEIEVELANGMERPVEVEVRERLPIVQEDDKDVEITVEVTEPAWKEWTQELSLKGGYRWSVTMEAAQKRKLYAKYVLKISAKHELAGGNRREA
jgi:hypothetical protein